MTFEDGKRARRRVRTSSSTIGSLIRAVQGCEASRQRVPRFASVPSFSSSCRVSDLFRLSLSALRHHSVNRSAWPISRVSVASAHRSMSACCCPTSICSCSRMSVIRRSRQHHWPSRSFGSRRVDDGPSVSFEGCIVSGPVHVEAGFRRWERQLARHPVFNTCPGQSVTDGVWGGQRKE